MLPTRVEALLPRIPAIVLVSALAHIVGPAAAAGQADVRPLWTTQRIESTVLNEARVLRVALPRGYELPQMAATRYPVLLVLDAEGDAGFAAVVAAAGALSSGGKIPELIVVGVENRRGGRFRDHTLPGDEPDRGDGGGGAMAFLEFLRTEVRPFLDRRYRTHPFTVIRGHSLSGLFARWAFGQAPDFLDAAIASSPTPLEQERILDLVAGRGRPGRLIMVNGTREVGLDREATRFADALRARDVAGLAFEHIRIPDAAHGAAFTLGIVPGLLSVFRPVWLGGYQVEFDDVHDTAAMLATFTAAFDSIRAGYLRGAAELGLPERLPFAFLNAEAQRYQGVATAPLQLRVCREMIESYPEAWNGHECAGDALVRMERPAEAAAHHRRALDTARRAGDAAAVERLARKAASSP